VQNVKTIEIISAILKKHLLFGIFLEERYFKDIKMEKTDQLNRYKNREEDEGVGERGTQNILNRS